MPGNTARGKGSEMEKVDGHMASGNLECVWHRPNSGQPKTISVTHPSYSPTASCEACKVSSSYSKACTGIVGSTGLAYALRIVGGIGMRLKYRDWVWACLVFAVVVWEWLVIVSAILSSSDRL